MTGHEKHRFAITKLVIFKIRIVTICKNSVTIKNDNSNDLHKKLIHSDIHLFILPFFKNTFIIFSSKKSRFITNYCLNKDKSNR